LALTLVFSLSNSGVSVAVKLEVRYRVWKD